MHKVFASNVVNPIMPHRKHQAARKKIEQRVHCESKCPQVQDDPDNHKVAVNVSKPSIEVDYIEIVGVVKQDRFKVAKSAAGEGVEDHCFFI